MSSPGGADLAEVRLLRLPVLLHARAQEHVDELLREFALIAEEMDGEPAHSLPPRLVALVEELNHRYSGFTRSSDERLDEALRNGQAELDLTIRVPPSAADAAARLTAMLDEADEYCRAGRELLTLATPGDALRYRRWYLGEIVAQAGGRAPTAWPEFSG